MPFVVNVQQQMPDPGFRGGPQGMHPGGPMGGMAPMGVNPYGPPK